MPRTTRFFQTAAAFMLAYATVTMGAGLSDGTANRVQIASPVLAAGLPAQGLVMVNLDVGSYAALKIIKQATVTGFPLADRGPVDLDVESFDPFSADAVLVLAGDGGERRMPKPELVLLRGHVHDHPESTVFLGLSPTAMNGYITLDGHTYILSSGGAGLNQPAVVYDLGAIPANRLNIVSHPCGTDALPLPPGGPRKPNGHGGGGGGGGTDATCRVIRVAIDTDYEYTSSVFSGNSANAAAYAATLLGAISEIYRRDFDVALELSYLRIWTSNTDPYTLTTVEDRLDELKNYWNANMSGIGRNITHMMTGLQAGTGGVAYLGVVCPGDYSYGSSGHFSGHFPYPLLNNNGQNWDVMVVAHEIGHNLNAPHTHSMTPPVDGCGNSPQDCTNANQGTIMSYCHTCAGGMNNIVMKFHPRTISEAVVPYLNGPAAGCLQVRTPVGILTQPAPQSAPVGGAAILSVVPSGEAPITYQWLKHGAVISDDAHVSGSTTAQLVISPLSYADDSSYSVKVSNACRSVTSGLARVAVVCYANCDGSMIPPTLTANDFQCFLNSFATGAAYANCDGSTTVPVLNANDFLCYLNAYATGCP